MAGGMVFSALTASSGLYVMMTKTVAYKGSWNWEPSHRQMGPAIPTFLPEGTGFCLLELTCSGQLHTPGHFAVAFCSEDQSHCVCFAKPAGEVRLLPL